MKQITLLQPRHSYAPDPSEQVLADNSLPNSLLHVQSRLIQAGVNAALIDHNVTPEKMPETDLVGITVLGMPYIPIVKKLVEDCRSRGQRVFVGGQIVDGLVTKNMKNGSIIDRSQLDAFFGPQVEFGNKDDVLSHALGIDQRSLPLWQDTSLVDAYEHLDETSLRHYMNGHMPFELGQGCGKLCTFCGIRDKGVPIEPWRSREVIASDLEWLARKAQTLGVRTLQFYLTNVDLFQTPKRLAEFAETAIRIGRNIQSVRLHFRGLCTTEKFLDVHDHHHEVIESLVRAGLECMGAGIDGWSKVRWKSVGKIFNTEESCTRFNTAARNDGIEPQNLMVYGGKKDTDETMKQANNFLRWSIDECNAVPRPHYEKLLIPGNVDWAKAVRHGDPMIDVLHAHPEYCQAFDFCSRPSSLTNPDQKDRIVKDKYFTEACELPNCLTKPVWPLDPKCSEQENQKRMSANIGNYDL